MLSAVIRRTIQSKLYVRNTASWPPPSLQRKYDHFQKDNGVPVYLKGGPMDKVLFGITLSLIAVGMADGLWTIFQMAKPKKK